MFQRSTVLSRYGNIANSETDPLKQIVMLYDGAIKFLNMTATDIEIKDLTAKAEHSTRALDIIGYLQSILDFTHGGEVAATLDNLYRMVTSMTLRASAELDPILMRRAAAALAPVRDAWQTNSEARTRPAARAEMSAAA